MNSFNLFALHDDSDSAFGLIRIRDSKVISLIGSRRKRAGLSAGQIQSIFGLSQSTRTINSWFCGTHGVPLFFLQHFAARFSMTPRLLRRIRTLQSGVSGRSSTMRVPGLSESGFFYLLGALVGDGSLDHAGSSYRLVFEMADAEILRRIRNCLATSLGIRARIRRVVRKDGRRSLVLAAGSKPAFRFFSRICGVGPRKSLTVSIPDIVFDAKPSMKDAFLFGLFETDGTNSKEAIRFYTSSQALSDDLMRLIRSLGFLPHLYVYSHRKRAEFQVCLSRADSAHLMGSFAKLEKTLPCGALTFLD